MVELRLLATEECVEEVSDALMEELHALSVSIEDADADSDNERALFGEPGVPLVAVGWHRCVIGALFADEAHAAQAATRLVAHAWSRRLSVQSMASVPEQDWVRLTQSQFAPVPVTADFWIVPSWHEAPVEATRVIRLDPGLAFGTGTHPTTRMCLRWLASQPADRKARWDRVLDYGCGSGILAIGAALHGAIEVDAVDIDPAAVEAARGNASRNGVSLRSGDCTLAHGRYALVLANILAAPLKLLAPLLCAHVEAGGDLVLAGILERQADELKGAYAPWLSLQAADSDEGWILMSARRAASTEVR